MKNKRESMPDGAELTIADSGNGMGAKEKSEKADSYEKTRVLIILALVLLLGFTFYGHAMLDNLTGRTEVSNEDPTSRINSAIMEELDSVFSDLHFTDNTRMAHIFLTFEGITVGIDGAFPPVSASIVRISDDEFYVHAQLGLTRIRNKNSNEVGVIVDSIGDVPAAVKSLTAIGVGNFFESAAVTTTDIIEVRAKTTYETRADENIEEDAERILLPLFADSNLGEINGVEIIMAQEQNGEITTVLILVNGDGLGGGDKLNTEEPDFWVSKTIMPEMDELMNNAIANAVQSIIGSALAAHQTGN